MLIATLGLPPAAVAQGFRVSGRVMHVAGADTLPVSERQVVLHRVSFAEAGPVDSGATDRSGRYTLQASSLDTVANYVVSVEHQGIAYFTEPLHTFGEPEATAELLIVYDTSATSPPITLRERHVVVRRPADEGARRVIELLVLENKGTRTRVAPDTSTPVWRGVLPAAAVEFEVGESDVSAEAISLRDNAVAVTAPIPPGERQLLVSYLIPQSVDALTIPIDQPIERFNVLLEDSLAAVEGPETVRTREELDQLTFTRYFAENIGAQTPVVVRFPQEPRSAADLWWVLVPLVGVSLLLGLFLWWRREDPLPAPRSPLPDHPDTLAAQIADRKSVV